MNRENMQQQGAGVNEVLRRWERPQGTPRWVDFMWLALPLLCLPLAFGGEGEAFWPTLAIGMGVVVFVSLFVVAPLIYMARNRLIAIECLPNRCVRFERHGGRTETVMPERIHEVILNVRLRHKRRISFPYICVVIGGAESRTSNTTGAIPNPESRRTRVSRYIFMEPMNAPWLTIATELSEHVGVPLTIADDWVTWEERRCGDNEEASF